MNHERRAWLQGTAAWLGAGAASSLAGGCGLLMSSEGAAFLTETASTGGHAEGPTLRRLEPGTASPPPPIAREWRAAWVASVAHIDWPKEAGLSAAVLREQVQAMVQRAQQIGLNALILQVRPAADALYRSSLEPPSEYLHAAGLPGEDFDALQVWTQACHAAGIELHAWFNPYRARHPSAQQPPHARHVARWQPDWVRRYGDLLWLDPGHPDAQAHSLRVVADVVQRYDIDGVHVDDYFYPYPIRGADGREIPFPDDDTYAKYGPRMGELDRDRAPENAEESRARWRRHNVNEFVRSLYEQVHAIKPWVRVSISPFGIGRPDRRPSGIVGFSQYDQLYADVEHWCEQGWFDALLPQLYWPRSRPAQSFEKLLDYWLSNNPHQRHLWPGLFTSSVANGTPAAWAPEEVLWQIDRQRERPGASGHAHFSLQALLQDRAGLATNLARGRYANKARPPATPWLAHDAPPTAPVALRTNDGRIRLKTLDGRTARHWAVWARSGPSNTGEWAFRLLSGLSPLDPPPSDQPLWVQALDRVGRAGPLSAFEVPA